MQCINPQCHRNCHDLQSGTLRLLELAIPLEKRVVRPKSGLPIVAVPSRYFWLCSQCSQIWKIKRWTPEGLLLANLLDRGQKHAFQTVKVPPAKLAHTARFHLASNRVA